MCWSLDVSRPYGLPLLATGLGSLKLCLIRSLLKMVHFLDIIKLEIAIKFLAGLFHTQEILISNLGPVAG
jgi:hypothetical protein